MKIWAEQSAILFLKITGEYINRINLPFGEKIDENKEKNTPKRTK
jgi:hypothetical protein